MDLGRMNFVSGCIRMLVLDVEIVIICSIVFIFILRFDFDQTIFGI